MTVDGPARQVEARHLDRADHLESFARRGRSHADVAGGRHVEEHVQRHQPAQHGHRADLNAVLRPRIPNEDRTADLVRSGVVRGVDPVARRCGLRQTAHGPRLTDRLGNGVEDPTRLGHQAHVELGEGAVDAPVEGLTAERDHPEDGGTVAVRVDPAHVDRPGRRGQPAGRSRVLETALGQLAHQPSPSRVRGQQKVQPAVLVVVRPSRLVRFVARTGQAYRQRHVVEEPVSDVAQQLDPAFAGENERIDPAVRIVVAPIETQRSGRFLKCSGG